MSVSNKDLLEPMILKPCAWALLTLVFLSCLMALFSWWPTFWDSLPLYKQFLSLACLYCLCQLIGAAFKP